MVALRDERDWLVGSDMYVVKNEEHEVKEEVKIMTRIEDQIFYRRICSEAEYATIKAEVLLEKMLSYEEWMNSRSSQQNEEARRLVGSERNMYDLIRNGLAEIANGTNS